MSDESQDVGMAEPLEVDPKERPGKLNEVLKPEKSGNNKKRRSKRNKKTSNAQSQQNSPISNFVFTQKRPLQSPEDPTTSTTITKKQKAEEDSEMPGTREQNDEIGDGITMRDALLSSKIAILPADYPNVTFTLKDVEEMEKRILIRIDEMDGAQGAPTFQYRRMERGYWKVACVGEATRAWITLEAESWTFYDRPVKVVPYGDLPKPPVFRSWIPGNVMQPEKILARLRKQNTGLSTDDWRHRGSVIAATGFKAHFEMDPASISFLKNKNWLLFFGMTLIKFTQISQTGGNTSGADSNKNNSADNDNGTSHGTVVVMSTENSLILN